MFNLEKINNNKSNKNNKKKKLNYLFEIRQKRSIHTEGVVNLLLPNA